MHSRELDPAPPLRQRGSTKPVPSPCRILASDIPLVPNDTGGLGQGLRSSKLRRAAHGTNEVL
jgi:hypothetical protein